MPHSLDESLRKFRKRRTTLEVAITAFQVERRNHGRLRRWAIQEAYTSWLWQMWSSYCREVIVESAKGALLGNGTVTSSQYAQHPEAEILFVCRQHAMRQGFNAVRPIAGMYQEPTWGDVGKAILVVQGLALTNAAAITTGLAAINIAADLQTVRNACAHLHGESVAAIERLRVRYDRTSYTHPSDALFWEDPVLRNSAWTAWCTEIDFAAEQMTR